MVLIGKIQNNQSTALLFKFVEATDKNNVFMVCPLHIIQPNT